MYIFVSCLFVILMALYKFLPSGRYRQENVSVSHENTFPLQFQIEVHIFSEMGAIYEIFAITVDDR